MYTFYPKIDYKFDDFNTIRMVDITVTTKIKNFFSEYAAIALQPYIIQNGERPDQVSKRIYDTPYYDYILLMVNNIDNIHDQWPRNQEAFRNYLVEKYGSVSYTLSTIGHYYSPEGDIVSQEFWNAISSSQKYTKTIYEEETEANDAKARIRVIDLPFIVRFESDLQELLSKK